MIWYDMVLELNMENEKNTHQLNFINLRWRHVNNIISINILGRGRVIKEMNMTDNDDSYEATNIVINQKLVS